MPVDNAVYDRMAGGWWDEGGLLHALAALNPARFGYMRRVLVEEMRLAPVGLHVLDVGCGGGLLTEAFARLGCAVTGVAPSKASLAAARMHAAGQGLAIGYHCALGEALPFSDESFDVVYCCDVLEHVQDVRQVIEETARVLRPGGTYLYDTINRTLQSRLIVIKLLQDWRWTALMPPGLHDWKMFIRPAELRRELVRCGLVPGGMTGLMPRANPFRLVRVLLRRKRGLLSYAAAVREMDLRESAHTSLSYIGYARKPGPATPDGSSRVPGHPIEAQDIMSEYRRLRPAFVLLHVTLALLLGIGGALTAVHATGAHAGHLIVLGSFEAVAAVLFLFPGTLRLGSAGLLLSCGVAFVAHAAMSQWRADLLVYMAAVLFVALHGAAYEAAKREMVGH